MLVGLPMIRDMGHHHRYVLCFVVFDEFRLGCGAIVDSWEGVYKRVDPVVLFVELPLLPMKQVELYDGNECGGKKESDALALPDLHLCLIRLILAS